MLFVNTDVAILGRKCDKMIAKTLQTLKAYLWLIL